MRYVVEKGALGWLVVEKTDDNVRTVRSGYLPTKAEAVARKRKLQAKR